jgi:hypothetical protein
MVCEFPGLTSWATFRRPFGTSVRILRSLLRDRFALGKAFEGLWTQGLKSASPTSSQKRARYGAPSERLPG